MRVPVAVPAALWMPFLCATLSGCATLSVPGTQSLQITASDAQGRPVVGLVCRVANDAGEQTVVLPGQAVEVQRSHSDLAIDCRSGPERAQGTVSSRRDRLEQAMLPFGSVGVAIDHVTGRLYSYPTSIHLKLGVHQRYEFSTEARVAEVLAPVGDATVADLGAAPEQRVNLHAATGEIERKPVVAAAGRKSASRPQAASGAGSTTVQNTAGATSRQTAGPAKTNTARKATAQASLATHATPQQGTQQVAALKQPAPGRAIPAPANGRPRSDGPFAAQDAGSSRKTEPLGSSVSR